MNISTLLDLLSVLIFYRYISILCFTQELFVLCFKLQLIPSVLVDAQTEGNKDTPPFHFFLQDLCHSLNFLWRKIRLHNPVWLINIIILQAYLSKHVLKWRWYYVSIITFNNVACLKINWQLWKFRHLLQPTIFYCRFKENMFWKEMFWASHYQWQLPIIQHWRNIWRSVIKSLRKTK